MIFIDQTTNIKTNPESEEELRVLLETYLSWPGHIQMEDDGGHIYARTDRDSEGMFNMGYKDKAEQGQAGNVQKIQCLMDNIEFYIASEPVRKSTVMDLFIKYFSNDISWKDDIKWQSFQAELKGLRFQSHGWLFFILGLSASLAMYIIELISLPTGILSCIFVVTGVVLMVNRKWQGAIAMGLMMTITLGVGIYSFIN